jgi:hypothetical protein
MQLGVTSLSGGANKRIGVRGEAKESRHSLDVPLRILKSRQCRDSEGKRTGTLGSTYLNSTTRIGTVVILSWPPRLCEFCMAAVCRRG